MSGPLPKSRLSEVDVYDFDKTIYAGDCSLDFYFFCLRRQPSLLKYWPEQIYHAVLFVIGLENRTNFKSHFFNFLRGLADYQQSVKDFWAVNFSKVRGWYLESGHANDVIVSASPEFLLKPAFAKLGAYWLIATRMDPKTGHIDGLNCRGAEKVKRLHQTLGEVKIKRLYTDSQADRPLMAIAEQTYIVKGNQITKE